MNIPGIAAHAALAASDTPVPGLATTTDTAALARQREHDVGVVRRFYELLSRKDIEAWSELWAEDGRIIIFYPPEGSDPAINGKSAITAAFHDIFRNFETFEPDLTAIYPAADSDAVVVEYRIRATLTGGVEYTNSNIAVFRFQDGLISVYHDYFDPRRFQVVIDAVRRH